jgi:type III restriction enzyme
MALHKDFPKDPYAILNPETRWFPADEDLREKGFEKLIPPLVAELRIKVKEWRDANYEGASGLRKNIFCTIRTAQHIALDTTSLKERL